MHARRLLPALVAAAVLAAPASAAADTLVINEIDYDQPSTDTAEFLEIRNNGTTAVNVDPYSLQFVNGANDEGYLTVELPASDLAPGGHLVVCGDPANVPACDVDAGANSNLIQNGDPDAVALLNAGTIVDTVSYEGAVPGYSEGSAGAPTDTAEGAQSISRVPDGCDTGDNAADFELAASTPGSSNGEPACSGPPGDMAPAVASSDPADGASDVALDSNVDVTFSEPVDAAGSAFSLTCSRSGAHTLAVSGGPTTFTLDPAGSFQRGDSCTLTVGAAGVTDQDADDPPDNMAADETITFTALGLELRIHEIQGGEHLSPYDGEVVSRVPGVVTARRFNGFHVQDPNPDGDDDTSEGIFVFTGGAPPAAAAVGAAVLVSGQVDEFAAAPENLSITEIVRPTVTPAGTGSIEPTVIGEDGRVPPSRIIDNDSFGAFDPLQDGIDFHETLEGMLVQVDDAVAVGPTNGFGETAVVGDGGRYAGPFTPRGGLIISPDDFNPERIILDDVISGRPGANTGDSFSEPIVAVADYSFGNYKYLPLATPARVDEGLEREVTDDPDADQLSTGSFNVENLHPGNPPSKFAAMADTLVDHMKAPDIVAVEEVQDNTGPSNDGTTDASVTWEMLIAAVEAAGGPTYEYRQIDPVNNQDGGQPGGNIRVGFLFRTDRGLEFVDRGNAGPTDATGVRETRHGAELTLSPGRIEPNDPAWTASRKPLAGEFRWRGRTVFAVANHFASKGGDDPLFGSTQPPVRHTENGPDGRHRQAAVVNAFVEDVLAADRRARVIVLGDLNDFEFSETLEILEGDELFNLMELLPKPERYSYVFDGNSQVLDQILATRSLMRPWPEYDSVHINAEFAEQTSDHDPQVARFKVTGRLNCPGKGRD